MIMFEISEDKYEKMSSLVEEILTAGGRLMSCVESLDNSMNKSNYRGGYRDDRYDMDYKGNMNSGMRRYPNY